MFMSALWDTIFEMNDKHKDMEVFLIDNHIPALSYGNSDNPTVYLAGFGSDEWESGMILLKFFDNLLSNIEKDTGMAGVRVKKAMQERSVIIIPAVCPKRMRYEGDSVSPKDLLPVARYLRFHKTGMVFVIKKDGASIGYPEYEQLGSVKPDTVGKILSACSKLPINKNAEGEEMEFCRWTNEVIGIPAFTVSLNNLRASSSSYIYKSLEETFLVTALL